MRFWLLLITLLFGTQLQAREITDLREFGDVSTSTMYLFTSPTCPHCRDFHKTIFPELIKQYVNTKRAQIVIVDMPYDPVAMKAVKLMRCLPEEKSTKMMGWLYENQTKWLNAKDPDAILKQYANVLAVGHVDFKNCLNDEHLQEVIEQQRDSISRLYGVRGWPTIALRQGNSVKIYSGTDKRAILYGLDTDIKAFQEEQKRRFSKSK